LFFCSDELGEAILQEGLDAFWEYNVSVCATTKDGHHINETTSDIKKFKTAEGSKKRFLSTFKVILVYAILGC